MKRTPFRRQRRSKAEVQAGTIAGKPWPASWMSEADWQETVEEVFHHHGWVSWHDNTPQRNKAGFLDLMLLKDRAIFVELKARDKNGRPPSLRPGQWEMIGAMQKAGLDVRVWTWPDSEEEMWKEAQT